MSQGIYTDSLLVNEDYMNYAYVETLTPAVEKTNSKNGTYIVTFSLRSNSDIFMILPSEHYAAVIYRNDTNVKLLTTGTDIQVQIFSINYQTLYPITYGLQVYNKDSKLIFTSQAAYLECYEVITDLSIENHITQSVGVNVGFIPTAPSSHAIVTGGYDFAQFNVIAESGASDLQLAMLGANSIDSVELYKSELGAAYLRGFQSVDSISLSEPYYDLLDSFGDTMFEPDITFDASLHMFKTKVIQMYRVYEGVFSTVGRVYSNLTQRFPILEQELSDAIAGDDRVYYRVISRLNAQMDIASQNILNSGDFTNSDEYDSYSAVYVGGQVMLARII